MTIRKKDTGENEIVKWGLGTNTFRTALLVLVLSQHPLGRQILGTVGFKFPDEQKIAKVEEKADGVNAQTAEMAKDIAALKTDVKAIATKVDSLDIRFHGFEVDFDKYRKEPK